MAILRRVAATGISPFASVQIQGDVSNPSVLPAGTTQPGATVLGAAISFCTTCPSSAGVQLPLDAFTPGDYITFYNGGSNTLAVYGTSTDTINTGSAGAAFSVGSHKAADFIRLTSTSWLANLSA